MTTQTLHTLDVADGPCVQIYRGEDARWVVMIDTDALAGDDVLAHDVPRMRVWVNDALIHDEAGRCRIIR